MDREFGGKIYLRLITKKTKSEAQKIAKIERKLGYYARVTHEPDGRWAVWISKWAKRK